MTRKKKKVYVPNGEMFEYHGKFYRAMMVDDAKPCKHCAFGKYTEESSAGCRDHVCELTSGGLFFEEVK